MKTLNRLTKKKRQMLDERIDEKTILISKELDRAPTIDLLRYYKRLLNISMRIYPYKLTKLVTYSIVLRVDAHIEELRKDAKANIAGNKVVSFIDYRNINK